MRCFVIGGGNSLEGFDFSRLNNEVTIGVNYIFKFFEPTYLIWSDERVYNENKEEIDRLRSIKYAPSHWIAGNWQDVKGFQIRDRFYPKEGLIKGLFGGKPEACWITGTLAISLACALEYSPIYLLGYDGGEIKGKVHFHNFSNPKEVFSERNYWYDEFKNKWEIYNCSLESKITQFPKIDIGKVLNG